MNKEMNKEMRRALQVHRGSTERDRASTAGGWSVADAFDCQDALRTRFTENWCKMLITGEHVKPLL